MRILFWAVVTIAGLFAGPGELAYARYFAGENIGDAVLFDDGAPRTHEFDVSETDLPIRLNLKMWGARETIDIFFTSYVTLTTGGEAPGDTIGFQAVIDEDQDLAIVSGGSGNFTLRPSEVPNMAQATQLFDEATPGRWSLAATASGEEGFSMKRIEASIKRNARAVNWTIAGPGLALLLVGFVMLVVSLRKRFPHLAS